MRNYIFLWLFLFSGFILPAQNYYVATVHGMVYYQDSLLKKRDKVNLDGQIRFTSDEDYVRLSGPGGLLTIRPGADPSSSNEFLVALRAEILPELRHHTTSDFSIPAADSAYYFLPYHNLEITFFERSHFDQPVIEVGPGEEFGYLHETPDGLIYRTAEVEDTLLVIRKEDFDLPEIHRSAIVLVRVRDKFLQDMATIDSLTQLTGLVNFYGALYANYQTIQTEEGEYVIEDLEYPAMIMDYMGSIRFIDRVELLDDLRFHYELSEAPDLDFFLYHFYYDIYIKETYGWIYQRLMPEVWRELGIE